jgi:chromosome partitioning protein
MVRTIDYHAQISPQRRVRPAAKMVTAAYRDDLNKIVILNPKGGCGKTTLATNLASYFALRGPPPTLVDTDPGGYSARWLERRSPDRPRVNGIASNNFAMRGKRTWPFRTPKDAGAIIIDTPAALDRREISQLTYDADCILIPILPSRFDIDVTTNFIAELLLLTELDCPVAVVANRTRKNTRSLAMLQRILTSLETPTIAVLRDTQNFEHAANLGLGIYEMPHHKVKQEIAQIDLVVDWLDQLLMRTLEPGLMSRLDPVRKLFGSHSSGLSQPS